MTALRRRVLQDMQVWQLSPHTQRAYVNNIAQFARHFGQSPDALGPEEIRAYQIYLTHDRQLAPSSIGMAVSALRNRPCLGPQRRIRSTVLRMWRPRP